MKLFRPRHEAEEWDQETDPVWDPTRDLVPLPRLRQSLGDAGLRGYALIQRDLELSFGTSDVPDQSAYEASVDFTEWQPL